MKRRAMIVPGGFATFEAGTNPRDPTLNPFRVEAPDVIAWVEARNPVAIGHWRELGREEYGRAFTAARTAGHDVIDDLYFAFADTIAAGGTEVDFARVVMPTLRAKGWLADQGEGAIARRLRLIYTTNLRLARAAGRWGRYQRSKAALPYIRAVTARDDRVRRPPRSEEDHTAWEGIVLPVDHPFWQTYFPPLGFNCRCGTIQMSRSQLARLKGGVTSEAELAARIARLGPPVFLSPTAPIGASLDAMVAESNASPMPGNPPIDVRAMMFTGAALWDSILADEAWKAVDEILARVFGQAA